MPSGPCPECGNKVALSANSCPNCGNTDFRIKIKRRIKYSIICESCKGKG